MTSRRALLAASLLAPCAALVPTAFARASAAAPEAAGRWQRGADIPWQVQEVYATVRGGQIVIAGGMIVDAQGRSLAIDRVGFYDPETDQWAAGPALPEPRHHPLLATVGEHVYAFGGATHGDSGGHWQQRRDVFVESQGAWQRAAPMPVAQSEGVIMAHEGRVHLISGRTPQFDAATEWSEQRDVDFHQVYLVDEDRWTTAAPIPGVRNSAGGGMIDGYFYVAGGRTMEGGNLARLDRYDPDADRWDSLAPMPHGAGGLGVSVLGGKLYAFGGEELETEGAEGVIGAVWRYDPLRDEWQALASMPEPRHGLAAAAIKNRLYAVGGGAHTGTGLTTRRVDVFEP